MAETGGGTPGGVVSIQNIITQIVSVQEGMNAVVDAVLMSSGGLLLTMKVKKAKRKIKQTTKALTELVQTTDEAVKEMLETLDTQSISDDFSKLVSNPVIFGKQATNPDPKKDIKNLDDKKAGILEVLIGLASAINLIADMDFPGPIRLGIRMLMLKLSLKILAKGIGNIIGSIKEISDKLKESTFDKSAIDNLTKMIKGIIDLCKAIGWLTLATMLVAPIIPLTMLGMFILRLGIKMIVKSINKLAIDLGTVQGNRVAVDNLIGLFRSIISLCGSIAWLTLALVLVTPLIPLTIIGLFMLRLGIKVIVKTVNKMGRALAGMTATAASVMGLQVVLVSILRLCGTLAWIAIATMLIAPITPIIMIGMLVISLTIRVIIRTLGFIGSPAVIAQATLICSGVRRLLRKLLRVIWLIAATIASIALMLILVAMVGAMIPQIILPFLLGLVVIAVMFGLIWLAMKGLLKISRRLRKLSTRLLWNILIVCLVIAILAITFMVIAEVSKSVMANLKGVIVLMGLMGLTLLAIMGFMMLAAAASPVLTVGLAAMAIIFVAIIVMVFLAGLLYLLSWISQWLDEEAAKEATDKVIRTAEYVIQAILNTSFKGTRTAEEDGDVRRIAKEWFGEEVVAIYDIAVKAMILMVTLFAVLILFGLAFVMTEFTKYVFNPKNAIYIVNAPKAVEYIMNAASTVVTTIANAKTGSPYKEDDGKFMALVNKFLGQDGVTICKLLFKVVIVAVTIVLLLMIRGMMEMMIWVAKAYNENKDLFKPGDDGGDASITGIIGKVLDACFAVIGAIVDARPKREAEEGDGKFIDLINWVSPELGTIIQLLFKVLIIAATMIVLAMIKVLVDMMIWLKNNIGQFKPDTVTTMVSNIMGAVDSIIDTLSTKPKEEPKPDEKTDIQSLSDLLDWIGQSKMVKFIRLLCSFARIGIAIMALSVLTSVTKLMKDVYTTYKTMGGENITTNATKMVRGIGNGMNAMMKAMSEIDIDLGNPEERDEGIGKWKSWNVIYNETIGKLKGAFGNAVGLVKLMDAAGNMRAAVPIITAIGAVAQYVSAVMKSMDKSIKDLGKVSDDTIPKAMEYVVSMVETINNTNLGDLAKCDKNLQTVAITVKKITDTFNKLLGGKDATMAFVVKNSKKYKDAVTDTDHLINKINGLNLAKMQVLAKMFGNAAAFSQSLNGNFDKLADVLSEKISPLIEELKEVIKEADRHIEEYTRRQEEAQRKAAEAQQKAAEIQQSMMSQLTSETTPEPESTEKTGQDLSGARTQPVGGGSSSSGSKGKKKLTGLALSIQQGVEAALGVQDAAGRTAQTVKIVR